MRVTPLNFWERARHNAIIRNVRHPLLHQFVYMLIGAAVLVGLFLAYQFLIQSDKEISGVQTTNTLPIKSYSFSGEVIKINESQLTIRISMVDTANDNTITFSERNVNVSESSSIARIKIQNQEVTTVPATLKDFRIRQQVVVYSKTDPNQFQLINAEKIEIIE